MNSTAVDNSALGDIAEAMQSALKSRATYQDFSSRVLPEGALERAIQAAIAAPNHRMTEPWRFIRTGVQTRETFATVQARLKDKGRSPSPTTLDRAREKMLAPAELLVVCCVRHADPSVEREDYAAVACAVQNLCLSLWSEGIGSKWGTGGVTTDAETYQALRVNVAEQTIVGFLSIGYAARDASPEKPPRRLGVKDVLRSVP
jgi:nitroreductase